MLIFRVKRPAVSAFGRTERAVLPPLVERLRAAAAWYCKDDDYLPPIATEAAALIEQQAARIEKLEAALALAKEFLIGERHVGAVSQIQAIEMGSANGEER